MSCLAHDGHLGGRVATLTITKVGGERGRCDEVSLMP